MLSYVVLAAQSPCGALTIQAKNAEHAAKLYYQNCSCEASETLWVWMKEDYHSDPSLRQDPMEYTLRELSSVIDL